MATLLAPQDFIYEGVRKLVGTELTFEDRTQVNIGEMVDFEYYIPKNNVVNYYGILATYKGENAYLNFIQNSRPEGGYKATETILIEENMSGISIKDGGQIVFRAVLGAGTNVDNLEEKYSSNSITLTVNPMEEELPPPPPVTAATGRLEQFQNSAGEQIYPQTIIEGIFRQSDSKPLSEFLSGIELPLSIEDGGTGADNAQTALANLIDGTDTSFQAASYGDVYIPISINGVGYRVPFTKVQLWTIGDRKSAVNQINTDYGIFMARGIAAGTSDYAAGSTAMTSGTIYLVYE